MSTEEKIISPQQKKEIKGTLFLMAAFFTMCVLKLWFTIFLIFIFAVIMTIVTGKGTYCHSYCPVGTIQEGFFNKGKKRSGKKIPDVIKYFYIISFWAITLFISFYAFNDELKLWFYMLQIMISALFIAIVAQRFKKRYFCSHLCPLRIPILKPIIAVQRNIKRGR